MWDLIIGNLNNEWPMIQKVPYSIITITVTLMAAIGFIEWIFLHFIYKHRLSSKTDLLNDRINQTDNQIEKISKLKKDLESANTTINSLGKQLLETHNNGKLDPDNNITEKAVHDAFLVNQSPLKIEFKGIFSKIEPDDFESYQTYWCEIYNPSDEPVKNVSVSLIYNQEHPLKYQRHGDEPAIEFSSKQRERVDLISCGKINTEPKQAIIIEGDGKEIWVDVDLGHLFRVKVTAKGYPALIKDFGFSIKGGKSPPEFKVYPG